MDRALGNRYKHSVVYSHLYIDLDDVLIVGDRVNGAAVKLVFQALNLGKKVTLLTRHRKDLRQTLEKYRLHGLFDEVIHVKENEKKSAFVNGTPAIFVDDSFSERLDVETVCGIPTFDCSMIELLTEQAEFLNVEVPDE